MREEIKKRIEAVRCGMVPAGYCKAHPYVIPNDWKVVKLGNITKRTSRPNKDGQDRPAYSINNRKGFVPQSEQFEEGSYEDLDKSAYKIVRKGEFAYNPARVNVGSIGRLRDAEEVAVSSLYVCVSVDDKVDGEYFDAWTKSRDFYKETVRNTEGSVREYLFYENFANMRMPIPMFAEQKKIAEILATCDRAIDLKQQLLEEKRRQKKWLMQKLLDPNSGTRVPGFEQSEWIEVSLLDCCIKKGEYGLNAPACEYAPELPRYIRITDIDDNGKYMKDAPVSVNVSDAEEYYLHEGDLLFVRTGGTTGKVYRYENGDGLLVYAGFLIRFSVNLKDYDDSFIYSQFSTMGYTNWVNVMSMRSGQPGINAEEYGSFSFWAPKDKAEQSAIAAVFKCKDREIELQQQDLQYWRQKKKALMQLLLTGLVRVNA